MMSDSVAFHGSAAALGERAVVIRGRSGAGKSSLAAEIIQSARLYGDFAALIGDDRLLARRFDDRIVISPHPVLAGQLEWRGLGILDWAHESVAVLGLVVDLEPEEPPRLPEPEDFICQFLGLTTVPHLRLPERATGRSVAAVREIMQKISSK